ncbi:hypothetical protein DMH04_14710 [Kibdelosporangium aridum]|uniref:Uncharacterized protein n=1 Tax=Kibdelosporangium aridum TaxID=2030 RepID=A0A428ZEC7_KIBAR|nr:hypothetical protein [Kibdelosporangium aridum]RSM86395.1 hypothetical protein DMH04_14710 [Kibdelosporangium aridum]
MDEHDLRRAFHHAAAQAPSWPPVESVLRAGHRARHRRRNVKIAMTAAAAIAAVVGAVTFPVALAPGPVQPATPPFPTTTTTSPPATQRPALPVGPPTQSR